MKMLFTDLGHSVNVYSLNDYNYSFFHNDKVKRIIKNCIVVQMQFYGDIVICYDDRWSKGAMLSVLLSRKKVKNIFMAQYRDSFFGESNDTRVKPFTYRVTDPVFYSSYLNNYNIHNEKSHDFFFLAP